MAASAPLAVLLAKRRSAVCAACAKIGIDEDERRLLVKNLTGHTSLKDCTMGQLSEVLDHLNRGKGGYAGRKRTTPTADRGPLLAKIDALLAELHRVTGEVHTLKYADAIAKRNGWAECVDFADPVALKHIVGALSRTLQFKQAK
ncbi:regulatory protein GemA [Aromatoleum toluclasticum]|uniref:phage protein GemA/Gp16 family protein n=1 Tax=Aromatoleum toluclasticum TaxID=92003 RepID=UPI001D18240F|nr:phage protein GemA/Gp16 family protein [Aromatoleum toluclasticum]MCC4116373.1 regulatory protein GemA [Aromatoleum toluclasticum]